MSRKTMPTIEPVNVKQYDVKQSKYHQCGTLPIRSVLLGPSGAGKGIVLQNMIMDIYDKCFERVYIFSPSVHVDQTWVPVKEYLKKEINMKESEPPLYYDHYDPVSLEIIIDTQRKIVEHQKKQKDTKKIFQIMIIVDDFADDPMFSRKSQLLHSLFTRGRHSGISTVVSTQKFTAIHPIIRVNATELLVFRLRNFKDLEAFVEEVSALIDKKTLLEIYNIATEEPYSFLYVKLNAKKRDDMFYVKYNKKISIIEESYDDMYV